MEECLPLKTFDEALCWKDKIPSKGFNIPLAKRVQKTGPKTLVCHDLKGGYLEDRFVQGVREENCYNFVHWSLIDIFIYFSHSLVTIPPYGWISAAHKNGTLILGTFITEWDEGAKVCEQLLKDMESIEAMCDALVKIALNYGFDGWLINIENKIEFQKVRCLIEFVNLLTVRMHEVNEKSLIIWYDSVLENGELKWQNCINEGNRVFFDNCDGIFLNYNWTEQCLKNCVTEAKSRLTDVYVGIDVFGRGCPGGGGFNSNMALKTVRRFGLSAAIFAPGWVYECLDQQLFWENQYKFWDSLECFCCVQPIKCLPFATSFCPGEGSKMYRKGKVISHKPWYNLGLQRIQPSYQHGEKGSCEKSIMIFTGNAYDGGGCLKLQCSNVENDVFTKVQSFKIMSMCIQIIESCIVTYTFKPQFSNIVFSLNFGMDAFRKPYSLAMIESKMKEVSRIKKPKFSSNKVIELPLVPQDLEKRFGFIPEVPDNGWITRYFLLDVQKYKGHIIKNLNADIAFNNLEQYCNASVLLGYIEITPITQESCLQVSNFQKDSCDDKIQISCCLSWTSPLSVQCWDVFYEVEGSGSIYLGTTSVLYFQVHLELIHLEMSPNSISFHVYPQLNVAAKPCPKLSVSEKL